MQLYRDPSSMTGSQRRSRDLLPQIQGAHTTLHGSDRMASFNNLLERRLLQTIIGYDGCISHDVTRSSPSQYEQQKTGKKTTIDGSGCVNFTDLPISSKERKRGRFGFRRELSVDTEKRPARGNQGGKRKSWLTAATQGAGGIASSVESSQSTERGPFDANEKEGRDVIIRRDGTQAYMYDISICLFGREEKRRVERRGANGEMLCEATSGTRPLRADTSFFVRRVGVAVPWFVAAPDRGLCAVECAKAEVVCSVKGGMSMDRGQQGNRSSSSSSSKAQFPGLSICVSHVIFGGVSDASVR
ncbi:hypothetical protein L249_0944, partial [Ophiocordyceps polyrhachis-furcata BCC 54312]